MELGQPTENVLDETNIPKLIPPTHPLEILRVKVKNGDELYEQGRFFEAFEGYSQALNSDLGPCNTYAIILHYKLGITSLKKGKYVDAQDYLIKAIEMQKTSDTGNLSEISLNEMKISLGEVYLAQAKYPEALNTFQETLKILLDNEKDKQKEIVICYNNLADLYQCQRRYHEALEFLHKAVQIALKEDPKSPELATSYYLKGVVYSSIADYGQAILYAKKSLNLKKELYGKQHPEIAMSYNTIGHVYRHQRNCTKALKYYNKALDIRLKFLGEVHPYVAGSYSNVGLVYSILGNYDKALENYRKCLETEIACLGESHPEVATTYNNIGDALYLKNLFENALEYCLKGLDIRIQNFGANHPKVADSYNRLGIIYHDRKETFKAFESYFKSLMIQHYHFEDNTCAVAQGFYNLGLLFRDSKDLISSEVFNEKSKMVFKMTFGEEHQDTKDASNQLTYIDLVKYTCNINADTNLL